MEIQNRKASFDYHFLETEVAGVCLTGSEVKSLRKGNCNFVDAYIHIQDNTVYIRKMYIAPYESGGYANHEPVADRKLLMTKKQIRKWENIIETNNGISIIPIRGFFTPKGIFKLEIALARGKKSYDKRESIKAKEQKRDIARNL